VTKRTGARYWKWYSVHDEFKTLWSMQQNYFLAPLHQSNYPFATLLALKYYEMYLRDPKSFIPWYLALMRNGYNAPPDILLKRFLRIDLRDPRLVSDACAFMEQQIEALEKLYRQ